MFWLGLVIGGTIGVIVMAVLAASGQASRELEIAALQRRLQKLRDHHDGGPA